MAEVLTQFNPASASTGTFQATFPASKGGKLVLWNESNVGMNLSWLDGGKPYQDYLPPWTAILIIITSSNSLKFTWTSTLTVANNPPASNVIVIQYLPYERVSDAFPIPLPRQMTDGNFIENQQNYFVYENTFTIVGGAHSEPLPTPPAGQAMYVKRIEFSSGSIGASSANCNMQLQGTDPGVVAGLPSWAAQVPANAGIPLTRLEFPGSVKGITGQAMRFNIGAPTGTFVALNVYYFFAAAAATTGGPLTTATQLINDGNAPLTTIIEATPSDAASSTWKADNSGNLTVKGDNAGALTTLLQLIAGASPAVQLGASSFNTEVLGGLQVDANQIIPNMGAANVQNGTSGTVSFYTPIWGTGLKVLLIVFNGFADNIFAHTFTLPTTISWGFWANGNIGVARIQFQSGGVSQTLSQISAINGSNGSSVGTTNAGSNAIGQLVSTVDTVFIATSAQGAASSIFVMVGV